MSSPIRRLLLGNPIPTDRTEDERVGPLGGLALFAPDAMSSVAYGPEEVLIVLMAAGTAGLAYGVPIGVALGRALWTALADRLGVVPDPITPLVGLLVLAAATLLLGGLLSYAGGVLLARTRPAAALRSE